MATYLITYDLHQPGRDYEPLHGRIKQLGQTWWHCLESVWIVRTATGAEAIRDSLRQLIDQNDELLVIRTGAEAAWRNFSPECSAWLQENLGE